MQYDFSAFDTKAKDIFEWLQTEYAGIRAGRATPQLLDSVRVSAYGAMSAMNQVASVTVEEARTLRVSVWDASLVKAVEKALIEADLGVSVVVDGNGMRVMFPELSSERREQLMKLAKTKLEEARISIRGLRDDENKKIVAELLVLVIAHEWGHFIVAKKTGMRVDEFGFGFPPKLWGKKYNGTEYSLNALPLGGFVKIYGED